jgi:hypothetical protein
VNALPIAFGAPALLFGLAALPIIWWLLRLTPPRPKSELFPPLRILARVLKKEETPAKSPWWLTLLRLMIAALVVFALARPVLNPDETQISDAGPLVILMDNGWLTAPDWTERVAVAERLIANAEEANRPVSILFTAERQHNAIPNAAATARERLQAAEPRPIREDPQTALAALLTAFEDTQIGSLAVLSSGLAGDGTREAWQALLAKGPADVLLFEKDGRDTLALTSADNDANGFVLNATRLDRSASMRYPIIAQDSKGRPISAGELAFESGSGDGVAILTAPFELRNDFASISLNGIATAATRYLLDDSFRRRRVALLSAEPLDLSQPLLSPLYYLTRALEPFADLILPEQPELSDALSELLEQRPSVLVMADIGTLPAEATDMLGDWIDGGGLLLRFAGPRLAGGNAGDPFVPVELRRGERALGGALSWSEPQQLAEFSPTSPFAGMPRPDDVTVSRQVLAEPSADLAAHTWASLADGTPLVTSREFGRGRIVLFHVTAEATWSTLPISGHFVEMLRRSILLSKVAGSDTDKNGEATLPPYRLLDANGALNAPSGAAQPLEISAGTNPIAGFDNPPGLYGTESGFLALNLMTADDTLLPFELPDFGGTVQRAGFAGDNSLDLRPILLTSALLLLIADSLIVLFMAGAFSRHALRRGSSAAAMIALTIAAGFVLAATDGTNASDAKPGDADILRSLDRTHLAYVVTGDQRIDKTSLQGMNGLTRFLLFRTSLEPGEPVGVDLEMDPLSLYSMLYWPISADADPPTPAAISRVDAFMKNGGTVLFDTRDALAGLGTSGVVSPETARLRNILAELDIPALEPVPGDHVLTKAFYILNDFPGRYRGSPLWVEAALEKENPDNRPARGGDGVSSIIITGNDLAGAWAVDDNHIPVYPTVPSDPIQREHAFRSGVNIMMYMLTGNYKADQVHVPALLERLGQ